MTAYCYKSTRTQVRKKIKEQFWFIFTLLLKRDALQSYGIFFNRSDSFLTPYSCLSTSSFIARIPFKSFLSKADEKHHGTTSKFISFKNKNYVKMKTVYRNFFSHKSYKTMGAHNPHFQVHCRDFICSEDPI